MKKIDLKNQNNAKIVMIYGDYGTGKTLTSLITAPRKTLYIEIEPRGVENTIDSSVLQDVENIDFVRSEKIDDDINWLSDNAVEIGTKYACVIIDSMSGLGEELEEEAIRILNQKQTRFDTAMKLGWEGFGAVGGWYKKCLMAVKTIRKTGAHVVLIARSKKNKETEKYQPLMTGQLMIDRYGGFCDLIGMIYAKDIAGKRVFPPSIMFNSNVCQCRWSGSAEPPTIYNLKEILK